MVFLNFSDSTSYAGVFAAEVTKNGVTSITVYRGTALDSVSGRVSYIAIGTKA